MSLRVLDPGLQSLIVDFGRPNYRSLGVPIGGAADRFSLALGNGLVGNPPGELHKIFQPEAIPLLNQFLEAVTGADECKADVRSLEHVDDEVGHLEDEIHSVLWSHDPDIGC